MKFDCTLKSLARHSITNMNIFYVFGAAGSPLEKVLSYLPTKSLAGFPLVGAGFVPPVSVEAVGRAAVTAATDSAVPAGLMDVWQIETYSNKV